MNRDGTASQESIDLMTLVIAAYDSPDPWPDVFHSKLEAGVPGAS